MKSKLLINSPLAEQLYKGPGRPLMVKASEIFGAPPDCNAWLMTVSVSAFHHSPTIYRIISRQHTYTKASRYQSQKPTENKGDFLVGLWERVGDSSSWEDDYRPVDCDTKPRNVRVPE